MEKSEQEQKQRAEREVLLRLLLLKKRENKDKQDLQSILEARTEALEVLKQAGENPEMPKV